MHLPGSLGLVHFCAISSRHLVSDVGSIILFMFSFIVDDKAHNAMLLLAGLIIDGF